VTRLVTRDAAITARLPGLTHLAAERTRCRRNDDRYGSRGFWFYDDRLLRFFNRKRCWLNHWDDLRLNDRFRRLLRLWTWENRSSIRSLYWSRNDCGRCCPRFARVASSHVSRPSTLTHVFPILLYFRVRRLGSLPRTLQKQPVFTGVFLVRRLGIEPRTLGLRGPCSTS
jgi:hypothetical protein